MPINPEGTPKPLQPCTPHNTDKPNRPLTLNPLLPKYITVRYFDTLDPKPESQEPNLTGKLVSKALRSLHLAQSGNVQGQTQRCSTLGRVSNGFMCSDWLVFAGI